MNWLIFRNKQASRKPSLLLVLWWKQKHDKRILAHLSPRKLFLYQDTINDGAFGSTGTVFDPLLQKTITAINGRCKREASRWMCWPQETKEAGHSYRSWFWVTKGKHCKISQPQTRLTNKDDRRNEGHLLASGQVRSLAGSPQPPQVNVETPQVPGPPALTSPSATADT